MGASADEIVPSSNLETAIDRFSNDIILMLEESGLNDTNAHALWRDLSKERADQELGRFRKLEALLGSDPDELPAPLIEAILQEGRALGMSSIEEIAAHYGDNEDPEGALKWLTNLEKADGAPWTPDDGISFYVSDPGRLAADFGVLAAQRARETIGNDGQPLTDEALAKSIGASPSIFSGAHSPQKSDLSFGLLRERQEGIIHLTGSHKTTKRFAASRILGDRLMFPKGSLAPATMSKTYRQQAQKAFAAEFLAPIMAVKEYMQGDYSEDSQESAAQYFEVSTRVIDSLLKNHNLIPRTQQDLEDLAA